MTDRQLAVLAAVERLGEPTIPELAREVPELAPSAVWAVVKALVRAKKVTVSGDLHWVYLGDPSTFPPEAKAPRIPGEDVVRVRAVVRTQSA